MPTTRALHAIFLLIPVALLAATPRPCNAQVIAPTPLHLASSDDLFNDASVHDIEIRVNDRDWQTLKANYLDDTYYPADIAIDDVVVRNIGIKSRGSGSRSGVKPGLKVDFGHYVSDQQFFGLK